MKQLMTTLMLAALTAGTASARTAISLASIAGSNTQSHGKIFRDTKFDLKDDKMIFKQLPQAAMNVYVMDGNGNVELSGTVSKKNNAINVSGLAKGYHIIALKKGSNIRMFGYYADIVCTGQRTVN